MILGDRVSVACGHGCIASRRRKGSRSRHELEIYTYKEQQKLHEDGVYPSTGFEAPHSKGKRYDLWTVAGDGQIMMFHLEYERSYTCRVPKWRDVLYKRRGSVGSLVDRKKV